MDLHTRKLWGDRFVWLLVVAATVFIVNQYVTRGGDLRLYLLYAWGAIVLWLLFWSELRVGRRSPRPDPMAFFAGWAAFVGEEIVRDDERRRAWTGTAAGKLEFGPDGARWTPRSGGEGPDELMLAWPDLYAWRIDGVIPLVWRASGYLTLTTQRDGAEDRDLVFHVHGLRRWRKALREAALIGPTFVRPEWLPDESAPELPVLLADRITADGPVATLVVGAEIPMPAYRRPEAEPPAPAPRPELPAPEPQAPAPEPQAPAPEPQAPAPEPQAPAPEPQAPAPEPQAPAPEPVATGPQVEGQWEAVIGLECHVELSTDSKIFCGCPTTFGADPNTQICPVCTGQPGTLPVVNERAVEYALRIALALNCDIAPESVFHRKNYFYPDMPKNYQISQYDRPLATNGWLEIELDGTPKRVGIHRVHIEEDTGKTTHAGTTGRIAEATHAMVDYNRAGVPLIEIVSEPDISTPDEARTYLSELRALLQAIGVSDVRMEEGSLRCDANVSVRPRGETTLGTKAEIKNMNSIRSVGRALAFEVERQIALIKQGGAVTQETRHFDEDTGQTLSLRSKEYAFDYRYFPDPDLVPLAPDGAWVDRIRGSLPELPAVRRKRFEASYGLPPVDARTLTASGDLATAFEEAVRSYAGDPKRIARWYLGELASLANERGVDPHEVGVQPTAVADLQRLIDADRLSDSMAKGEVLRKIVESGRSPSDIVEEAGLAQISDTSELEAMAEEVIASNAGLVAQIRDGKHGAINALVGQVMKRTQGRANPQIVKELFERKLGLS